jgi:hypothetical protein
MSWIKSYVTTDGQSASLSWNKAPIWGLRPDLDYSQTVAGLLMWGVLCDERTGLSFAILLALSNAAIIGSESLGAHDHILRSQIRDFPFRPLQRLAGRYSTPPPHGILWPNVLNSRIHCLLHLPRSRDRSHHVEQFLCSVVLARECLC